MKKGTVINWICDRGYGFIETKKGNERLFVHRSDLIGAAYLQEGEKVEFKIEETKKGPKAIAVKPIFSSVF
jgi:CspA family cold shock protein